MQVMRRIKVKPEIGEEMLQLKTEKNIKVLNEACMEAGVKYNLLVLPGWVGNRDVNVSRDTDCSGVVFRSLVDETDITGEVGHMMMVDWTI